MKLFKPELEAWTNAGQTLRLVATATALGLLAVALIFLTQVFSITSVIYLVLLAIVGAPFVIVWIRSDPNQRGKNWYARELSEKVRKVNIRQYEKSRAINKILIIIGCAGVLMAIIFGMGAFAPAVIAMFTIGFVADRYSRGLRPCENIDDPHERLAARTAVKIRFHTDSFWMLTLLGAALVLMWIVINIFGVMTPRWLELMLHVAMFGMLVAQIGAVSMIAGFNGHWIPAEAHCTACGYAYDTAAAPVFCSECGGVMCSDTIAHWRRKRNPRLIAIGGAYVAVGILSFVSSTSANRPAMLARMPTAGLITRVTASYSTDANAAWAELQTRMPLSAEHSERLLDAVLQALISPNNLSLTPTGIEQWISSALPDSPAFDERFEKLVGRMQRGIGQPDTDLSAISIGKILFGMPPEALKARQLDRLVDIGLELLENHPVDAGIIYADAWLLGLMFESRLDDVRGARVAAAMSAGHSVYKLIEQPAISSKARSGKNSLILTALESGDVNGRFSLSGYLLDAAIAGDLDDDQMIRFAAMFPKIDLLEYRIANAETPTPAHRKRKIELSLLAIETTPAAKAESLAKIIYEAFVNDELNVEQQAVALGLASRGVAGYGLASIKALTPEQQSRQLRLGLSVMENYPNTSTLTNLIIDGYISGVFDADDEQRLRTVSHSLTQSWTIYRQINLWREPLVYEGLDREARRRLIDLSLAAAASARPNTRGRWRENMIEWLVERRNNGEMNMIQISALDSLAVQGD